MAVKEAEKVIYRKVTKVMLYLYVFFFLQFRHRNRNWNWIRQIIKCH